MLKAIQTFHALTCVATDCHIGCKTNNRALHRRFARLVPGCHIAHQRVLQHIPANGFNDITSLINEDGAKHQLRGFMPRNRVAPYEMRSSEVRGNGFVIKQMRLADAKSAPIPSSRRLHTTSNRFRALRRRYARLVPGYHILHHKGAATRSCERPLRHHIIDKRGRCEAPIEGLYTPK